MTYVNHKVARNLKELGFDLKCQKFYVVHGALHGSGGENWNKQAHFASAPDIYTAVKWLWEKYKVWLEVGLETLDTPQIFSWIWTSPNESDYKEPFNDPDEAYHSGLEAACNWIKENR